MSTIVQFVLRRIVVWAIGRAPTTRSVHRERGSVMARSGAVRLPAGAPSFAVPTVDLDLWTALRAIGGRRMVLWPLAFVWLGASVALFFWMKPADTFFFHAPWLLHPQEQEHLMLAKHFAETGSLSIRNAWYGLPGHGSEDGAFADGAVMPRASLLVYVIYAIPFLFSDTAWLWVTPAFAIAGAWAVFAIIRQRTFSSAAGAFAAIAFALTAPLMVAGSGLAFENTIALAFLLWGVYALDRSAVAASPRLSAMAGIMFTGAALVRPDYGPAGILAFAAVLVASFRSGKSGGLREWRAPALRAGAMLVPLAAGALAILVTNRLLYGDALETGYAASVAASGPVWSGSAGGVLQSLRTFELGDFFELANAFLWQIGRAQTLLLLAGVSWLAIARRPRRADVALVGFSLFTMWLHLGHVGATGGAEPILVHSPPRYLLPVYATGIILGFEALTGAGRLALGRSAALTATVLAGVTLVIAGRGLQEAFGTPYGFVEARSSAEHNRAVHDFSRDYPDAVFVGDVYTKGLIDRRAIIPRLLPEVSALPDMVRQDLAAGHRVFITDSQKRMTKYFPAYSGYHDVLAAAGLRWQVVNVSPFMAEVTSEDDGVRMPVSITFQAARGEPVQLGVPVYIAPIRGSRIERVEMMVDGEMHVSTTMLPLDWSWDSRSVGDGWHAVTFRAIDHFGKASEISMEVEVRNNQPGAPVVRIESPARNETLSGLVRVRTRSRDDDSIQRMTFYVDGRYVGSDETAPYEWTWITTAMSDGPHTIWAKAVEAHELSSVIFTSVVVKNE